MKRAFVITLELNDDVEIDSVEENLWDAIEDEGYEVLAVDAWATQDETFGLTDNDLLS